MMLMGIMMRILIHDGESLQGGWGALELVVWKSFGEIIGGFVVKGGWY